MIYRSPPTPSPLERLKRALGAALRRLSPGPAEPSGVQLCDFGGVLVQLDLAAPTHRFMYRHGGFEPELTRMVDRVMRPGDVFVDVGANVGWHTLSLLVKRPDVRYGYAFEPSSAAFPLLQEGIRANRVEARCQVRRLLVGESVGEDRLLTFPDFGSPYSSRFPLADWEYEEEVVAMASLDALSADFVAAPAVVKCDVEGGEKGVLLGAEALLGGALGRPPIWFLEANYETSGMAGYFPWNLIEIAARHNAYKGYFIRDERLVELPRPAALRHGDTLVLAIPEVHAERFPD